MKYVILRDDDTNALTPIEYLEKLYRPFLDRGLPVNLATIPNVNTEATYAEGQPELFLLAKKGPVPKYLPIGCNEALVDYLRSNPCYRIVQHGCRHEFVNHRYEFDHGDGRDIASRLDEGRKLLMAAGFPEPKAFVAPYDQISKASWPEVARRFPVISTGWFQLGRLPKSWWPAYVAKKIMRTPHWRHGSNTFLSHPGCHLSYHRPYQTMLDEIKKSIESRRLTVLVTHWWEYFRNNKPDEPFIKILHDTAEYLSSRNDIQVISFADLAEQNLSLN